MFVVWSVLCVVVCGCVGMEGGRRRCFTEKAVDLPERVIMFCFSLQFQALSHMLTLRQHMEKCLKLQREAKNDDTLWKVNGTTTITCKKKTRENHELVHTRHTTYTTRTTHCLVSSRLFFLLFSSLLFSSLLFSSHVHLFRKLVEINLRQHVRWLSSTM